MKSPIFIDTGHVLALIDTNDEYHEAAKQAINDLTGALLTTEAVLTEIGNALARIAWRWRGIETIKTLRQDRDVEIVSIDTRLFESSCQLYYLRPDKEWSLTDCISFVVMQERNVTEALTADHHFEQAGFRALLRGFKKSSQQP